MRNAEILRLLNVFSLGRVFGCLDQKAFETPKTRPFLCGFGVGDQPPPEPARLAVLGK